MSAVRRTTPPSIDDFHPPYRLGAFGCALLGTWSGAPAPPPSSGGFEPLRVFGRPLGAALVLRYDRPPPDHPTPYSEIILAHVVRRGLELAVMPFDLVLDDAFFVEAGVRYYHLPKRLDPTLRLDVQSDGEGRPQTMTATANGLSFSASFAPTLPGVTPLASRFVRIATELVPVIGSSSLPLLRATIAVIPDGEPALAIRRATLGAGPVQLRMLAGLFWPSLAVTVGVPAPLAND